MNLQQAPIETLHLFPVLDKLLIDLLRSLSPEDWHKPTVARLWTVKDVAAHLLDGNIRAIALADQYEMPASGNINSYRDLVDFLNDLNATWVNAMKRVSPQWLVDQLEHTGKRYAEYLNTLDAFAEAKYAVAWAGQQTSFNWFHIAREYTEKWHHQQQIRDAVGAEGLFAKELFYPCIDTFMFALPYNYRNVEASEGTTLQVNVSGDDGGVWYLQRNKDGWQLQKETDKAPATVVTISPDIAWRMFTKALPAEQTALHTQITGDRYLANTFFNTVAVMA